MRITSGGSVGIGTTSPARILSAKSSSVTIANFESTSSTAGLISFSDSNTTNDVTVRAGAIGDNLVLQAGGSERLRIDSSGNLLVGTTSAYNYSGIAPLLTIDNHAGIGIRNVGSADAGYSTIPSDNHNYYAGYFLNSSGSGVGNISCTSSSTAYNTSSDYRLKENVITEWDATTRLKQLKPARFNFKADADTIVDGFIAHEVQEIVPEAITGGKDAVDADGNPDYQGIDQSKLVPLLVKTIQELEARITALES
tara:strand:- start:6 stop:767 length:762 start_codon:yes stop_codon:yes gene_type:complete